MSYIKGQCQWKFMVSDIWRGQISQTKTICRSCELQRQTSIEIKVKKNLCYTIVVKKEGSKETSKGVGWGRTYPQNLHQLTSIFSQNFNIHHIQIFKGIVIFIITTWIQFFLGQWISDIGWKINIFWPLLFCNSPAKNMDPQKTAYAEQIRKDDRFWLNKIKGFVNNLLLWEFVETANYNRTADSLHHYRFYSKLCVNRDVKLNEVSAHKTYLPVTFPSFAVVALLMKKKKSKQISLVSSITTGHHGYHWPPHAATMTPKPHPPTPNRAPYINLKKRSYVAWQPKWCSILKKNNSQYPSPNFVWNALRTFGPNKINKQISNIKSLRCIA